MPENITEKEALKSIADPKDNLIDALFDQVIRANMRLINAGKAEVEPTQAPAGIRVIDRKSVAHEYPDATSAEVSTDGDLTVWQKLTEADQRPVAIFNSWDYVERINPIKE